MEKREGIGEIKWRREKGEEIKWRRERMERKIM